METPKLPSEWPPTKDKIPTKDKQWNLVGLIDQLIDNCERQVHLLKKLKQSLLLGWACDGDTERYKELLESSRFAHREGRLYSAAQRRVKRHLKELENYVITRIGN